MTRIRTGAFVLLLLAASCGESEPSAPAADPVLAGEAEPEAATTAGSMVKVMTGRWERVETIPLTGQMAAILARTAVAVVQTIVILIGRRTRIHLQGRAAAGAAAATKMQL